MRKNEMSKKVIKVMSLCMAIVMVTMLFGACTKVETKPSAASKDKKIEIGIVQIVEHPSLDEIRTSFIAKLEELGYKDKVVIDYQNAQNDQSNLNSICQKFVGDKKDLIVAIATPSAQAAASATQNIPVLFAAVTDPKAAKLVDTLELPGANVTGTSDAIPVDQILELSKKVTPGVKKIGLVYSSSEVNSMSVINDIKKAGEKGGFTFTEATITNTSELQQAAQSLVGKVDAVFTPIDNTVASAMDVLSDVAKSAKLPLYVGADSMVKDGGFATVGVNYTELGKKTAQMADKILKGEKTETMPVEVLTDFAVVINQKTAQAIGVEIPAQIKENAQLID